MAVSLCASGAGVGGGVAGALAADIVEAENAAPRKHSALRILPAMVTVNPDPAEKPVRPVEYATPATTKSAPGGEMPPSEGFVLVPLPKVFRSIIAVRRWSFHIPFVCLFQTTTYFPCIAFNFPSSLASVRSKDEVRTGTVEHFILGLLN